jgi:PAS domain S-box-containing protein
MMHSILASLIFIIGLVISYIMVNISEQEIKKSIKIKENEKFLQCLIESIPLPVFQQDVNGVYKICNSAFSKFIGLPKVKIIGNKINDIMKPDFDSNNNLLINDENQTYEVKFINNNTENDCIVNKSLIKDLNNNISGFIGIIQDITELKKAKLEAEKANKAKSLFLANVSHELRTPLNGILGFTDIIISKENDVEKREMLEIIKTSGNTLLNIINDLLDLSKIESGKLIINQIPFNFEKTINKLYSLYMLISKKSNIAFNINLNNIPSIIISDQLRIEQIIINLLNNAFKFTSQGQVDLNISLVNTDTDTRLLINITDTGIGIDENSLKKIFNIFEQADETITKKFGGSGLGLAIVNNIVNLMEGKISVKSTVGKGTTFNLEIPVKIPNDEILKQQKQKNDSFENINITSNYNILLVEDNKINQELIKQYLNKISNLNLILSDTAEEAIDIIKNKNIDLFLIDIQLPGIDGFNLTRIIRNELNIAFKPIIIISAYGTNQYKEKAFEFGVNEYLVKPILKENLIDVISKYLK